MRTTYRGFTIELKADGEWSAEITNATTGKHWSQRLKTPVADGSAVCLKRAQNLVDAFLALHGAP